MPEEQGTLSLSELSILMSVKVALILGDLEDLSGVAVEPSIRNGKLWKFSQIE